MIKVACPSCEAPYELDERRLPSGGLKMRCPKCGSSFGVKPDGAVGAAGEASPPTSGGGPAPATGGGSPAVPRPAVPKPPAAPPATGGGSPAVPRPAVPKPPAAAPAPKKKPIAPPVEPSGPSDADADLPAPKRPAPPSAGAGQPPGQGGAGRKLATPFDDWDADLPAPKRAADDPGETDLPALKGTPAPAGRGGRAEDRDPPAPKKPAGAPPVGRSRSGPGAGGVDSDDSNLPAPKRDRSAGDDLDELDLPMPKSAPGRPAPAPGSQGAALDELDLPAPRGEADLPAPKGEVSLDELDLPAPRSEADLPAPKGEGGLDELDLPMARGQADLPASAVDRADLPVRQGQADLPARGRAPAPGADPAGEDLPGLDLDPPEAGDDLPLPEPKARPGAVDASGAAAPADGGEGLEFDAIPEERPGEGAAAPGVDMGATAQPSRSAGESMRAARARAPEPEEATKPKPLRAVLIAAGILTVLVAAGLGLGLTSYGYFGVYYLERFLPAAGDPAEVRAAIDRATEQERSDTLLDARAALRTLASARSEAGLNRELLARSMLAESLFQVRFGEATDAAARAAAIRARLDERSFDAPHADLARAAHALARGELQRAERFLGQARAASDGHPLLPVVEGEVALAQGRHARAAKAFRRAAERDGGARATWGLARALREAGDEDGWVRAVEDTLERSPRHAAARVLLAEKAFAEEDGTRAERLAREVVGAELVDGEPLSAAAGTRAAAWTQLGRIREQGGQRGRARAAYERALEADPYRVGAQLGMGRVLLTERQFSDALARFRAALEVLEAGERDAVAAGEARPEVAARIGTVQALVALDRVREARDTMTKLLQDHPEDPRVVLWVGKTAEADDDTEAAEERYREVIRMAPKDFAGYLALAQLFFEKQRPADAAAALRDARDNVPETAEMRRMLGESELRRGRYDRAIEGFERALELEPGDTSSLFGIGVAHQRADRLDEAARVLDDVAERDPSYPGLALERGRIYEARGRAERAARSYREALEKRPGDLDLMLRLGAALVASDDIDEAEEIVEKVTRERTHSAEAEYLLGRVALKRDRPDDALAHFERAVQIDGTRGELHLYRARALLEQGSLARAHKAVEAALERDSDLGDAYWVRGELRLRSGAVKDAAADFEKALELNPERLAAHAGMGESYDQLGKRRDAIRAYEAALEHDDSRGDWWYRLGRLQLDAGQRKRASETLSRAIELGDASESAPGWLADAHRLQGDTFRARRQRRKAIAHYRRYLEVAPEDAVDRQEVERKLRELD